MHKLEGAIRERVERAISEKVFPGCVIGSVNAEGEREIFPFGNFTYDGDSPPVRENSIYDVASITKSIPTASLALLLISKGKIHLNDLVRSHLPELQNDYDATIEHLLRYNVAGTPLSTLKEKTAKEILEYVFERGFEGPPVEIVRYSNLPALLLGLIVERVSRENLDILAQRELFDPLQMTRTTFFPQRFPVEEIVPTEIDEGGVVRGIVHDESTRVFAREGRAVGHAGLFSTAPDILNFLDALLHGAYPPVIEGAEAGLGWGVNASWFMGRFAGEKTFGKTGFTGTDCVCDRERDVAFVVLSNRTYPKRPANDDAINSFRTDIADMFLGPKEF